MIRHMLIPLDGSPLAERILEPAIAVATLTGADVTLLRVLKPLLMSTGAAVPRSTLSATLPRNRRGSPLRPCVAMATRSIFRAFTCSRMATAGWSWTSTCV